MSEVKKENWGAWKRQTAKGEVINFAINGKKYSMWVNSYKTEAKQPDFKIYEDTYVAENAPSKMPKNDSVKPQNNEPIYNDDLEF